MTTIPTSNPMHEFDTTSLEELTSIATKEVYEGTCIDLSKNVYWKMVELAARHHLHIDEYAAKVIEDHVGDLTLTEIQSK
tara:strand:+ start:893 stop:1132 length:240 start_codon:yes stop_codon:yes gene_type:complete